MAFAIAFKPTAMDGAQYDECIRRLEAAGAGAALPCLPRLGRSAPGVRHLGVDGDVPGVRPDSGPILQALGVDPGAPEITPIHNVVAPPRA
jgi:hypothetical protein